MNTGRSLLTLGVSFTVLLLIACSGEANPTPKVKNLAPSVGASAEATATATLELQGKVTDDTLGLGGSRTKWTKVTGPGPVTFGDPSAVNTTASFTEPGVYVLRLTAWDGQFTVSDDVTVTVKR